MHIKIESSLDHIGLKILDELQHDSRLSFSEIGRRVGLSSPAVAERVKKMEEAGIISGYQLKVDLEKIGFPVAAFVFLTTVPEKYKGVYAFAEKAREIRECHGISGNESFLLKVRTHSISHLYQLVDRLVRFGDTKTHIVLSSHIAKIPFEIES